MTQSTIPNGEASAEPKADKRNLAVLADLKAYFVRHKLDLEVVKDREVVAKRMGSSETYVYRYLNNIFQGRQDKFETLVQGFLAEELLKIEGNTELVADGFIVAGVAAFLRQAKAHGSIGVGYSEAGRGKTCGAKLYAARDKTAIYIHAWMWLRNRHDLVQALKQATGVKTAKDETIDQALVRVFTRSDRLIIIDNAQRLTESARRWLADFWEMTRCSIALIGNPEILSQWKRNDQHGSRVGLRRDVSTDLTDAAIAKASAAHLIRLHLPEAIDNKEVMADAVETIAAFGSCRAVWQRATLAKTMLRGGKITDVTKAFKAAKTQLITAA